MLAAAEAWRKAGREVAIATVVETWGSAPRPVGSHLVVDGEGNFEGSVSGGCVEGAVVGEALDVIADGKPKMLEFGVADETAWRVGLSCGGRIKVYVEKLDIGRAGPDAMKLDILQRLNVARHKRQAAILITDTESGHLRLVVESDGYEADPLREELRRRFASGASGIVAGAEVFLTVHLPPPRLVVIGAVHISQALAPMAKLAGFDMTIVDPRTAFATDDRFPDVTLMAEWPEDVMPRLGSTRSRRWPRSPTIPRSTTARWRRRSAPAASMSARSAAGRRTPSGWSDLRAVGLDDAALARIHAPIGVAIGAQSPAEIAVAILAEVIGALRSRGAWRKRRRREIRSGAGRRSSRRDPRSFGAPSRRLDPQGDGAHRRARRGAAGGGCRRGRGCAAWSGRRARGRSGGDHRRRSCRARGCAPNGRSPAGPISAPRLPAWSSSIAARSTG